MHSLLIEVMNVDGHKVSYFQNFRIIESSFFLAQLSFLCIRAHNDHSPHKTGSLQISIVCTRALITSVPIWGSHLVCIRCKVELGLHIPHVIWLAIQIQQWRVGLIFKINFSISVDFISGLILMALDSAFPTISDAFPPKTFKQKL